LYDPLLYQSYNLFFTAIPIIVYAIFDEEFTGEKLEESIDPSYIYKAPELYEVGRKNFYFNYKVFLYWITIGALFAAFEGLWTCSILEGSAMV
jgi:magnesium-transporting ATPase (P-type)